MARGGYVDQKKRLPISYRYKGCLISRCIYKTLTNLKYNHTIRLLSNIHESQAAEYNPADP